LPVISEPLFAGRFSPAPSLALLAPLQRLSPAPLQRLSPAPLSSTSPAPLSSTSPATFFNASLQFFSAVLLTNAGSMGINARKVPRFVQSLALRKGFLAFRKTSAAPHSE
jgi:hypothetical protein